MHASGVLILTVALLALPRPTAAATKAPSWMDQSWFFAWDPPGAPFPVPITAQCDTIHITWSRQTATGPDPVAPYYLQIYTSNFIFPFIVDAGSNPETYLTIPFAPGTQYQVCMFDSNNSTGGCQAVYTVYPNTTTSNPTCANLTMPAKGMNVLPEASNGRLSQYGWVDSCSDIRVTPKEGTPPFTFTVAPALHPPLNITSNDMSPINWTVSLSWASPFFISLVDSTGLSWSNGPIHAGKGSTACFSNSSSGHSMGITVGATIAGTVGGALASLLAAFFISKRRRKYNGDENPVPFYPPHSSQLEHQLELQPLRHSTANSKSTSPRYERLPSLTSLPEFQVEPFVMPSLRSHPRSSDDMTVQATRQSWNDASDARTHSTSPTSPTPLGRREASASQVYVIHHDSGRAPVSVVTAHGTEVVELPPGYSPDFAPRPTSPSRAGEGTSVPRRQVKSPLVPARDERRTT